MTTTMKNDLDAVRARTLTRLRTLATGGEQRRKDALFNARERCYQATASSAPEPAERVANLANAAALAEAELRGYRAAVADLLGALEVGL